MTNAPIIYLFFIIPHVFHHDTLANKTSNKIGNYRKESYLDCEKDSAGILEKFPTMKGRFCPTNQNSSEAIESGMRHFYHPTTTRMALPLGTALAQGCFDDAAICRLPLPLNAQGVIIEISYRHSA
jgi:hypothetical protein